MRYCKKCVMPDTRPFMNFNEEGICEPCLHFEKKKRLIGKKDGRSWRNCAINTADQMVTIMIA